MSDTTYIENSIYSHIVGDSGISAIVSERVYPAQLPQGGEIPAIMFRSISGNRQNTHGETGAYVKSRFEFNVYGETFDDAATLCRLLISLFDTHRGTMGSGANEHEVDRVEVDRPVDDYDDDLKRYRRQFDAIFHHRET